MSDDQYIDKLTMPRSALGALVKAVPGQLVKKLSLTIIVGPLQRHLVRRA